MRKFLILMFAVLIALSLVACGGQAPAEPAPTPEPEPTVEATPESETTDPANDLPDIELDGMWLNDRMGVIVTFLGDAISYESVEGQSLDLYGTFAISGGQMEIQFDNGDSFTSDFKYADNVIYLGGERLVRLSADELAELRPEQTIFEVGDTAIIGDWEVTVNFVEWTNRVQAGRWYYNPLDELTFLYVELTVTNLGTSPETFLSRLGRGYEIVYDDTFTFPHTRLPAYRDSLLEGMLTSPLTSSTGSIVFSIADRAVESDGSLILTFSIGREEISFNVRP